MICMAILRRGARLRAQTPGSLLWYGERVLVFRDSDSVVRIHHSRSEHALHADTMHTVVWDLDGRHNLSLCQLATLDIS